MIVAVDDSPKSIALEVLDMKYATDISGSDQSKLVFGCRCEAVNFEAIQNTYSSAIPIVWVRSSSIEA
ncbi:unnamed protein product [Schistosoma bovis]|nr:unnamed protein product [Schistosoma bovis]